ncbi:putative F-box protein At4g21240 [Bidens hawaiensis]|uniref:putative F-box protein At4g21240 n=1 Tax=Bidens hawaiensis TaxID=980011 RepID=UPI00404AA4E0
MVSRWHPSMEDENLILEVLSRLPVKSIMCCRCMCRKWWDLLSGLYFVGLHLSRSHEALMVHEHTTWPGSLVWVDHEWDPVKGINLKFCGKNLLWTPQVGSVNGLVCCTHGFDEFYILNPVLEEYINLPKPRFKCVVRYGFGVSMAGEYKVILLCGSVLCSDPYDIVSQVYTVEIKVYTLGTAEWRVLGQTPYRLNLPGYPEPGVYVNSHVYWLDDGRVYDFDLNKETFELCRSPPGPQGESMQMLGVLKGRLGRVSWGSLGLEVWVMKDASWCKEITIENPILPSSWWRRLLCLTDGLKGTGILMVQVRSTNEMLAYCLNTNTILHSNFHGANIDSIMTYRPSFIKLYDFASAEVYAL